MQSSTLAVNSALSVSNRVDNFSRSTGRLRTRSFGIYALGLLLSLIFLSACTYQEANSGAPFQMNLLGSNRSQEVEFLDSPSNRLVVLGRDGNIYTIKPDGSEKFSLTDDASRRHQYSQPTWSPDGEQIVFTEIDSSSSAPRAALVASKVDGEGKREVDLPFAPFYIFWSPDSERLVYLSNWAAGGVPSMAMRMVEVSDDRLEDSTLAQGQPFYMSWSPDGQNLLTHVGNEQVAILPIDGDAQAISDASSNFPAPQWMPDGSGLIYGVDGEDGRTLVLSDLSGEEQNEVTVFEGSISFTLSPTTRQMAYVVSAEDGAAAAIGPLYVVDVDTNRTQELSADRVMAFFWSPDGQKLAYQVIQRRAGSFQIQWKVWDGQSIRDYGTFLPTRMFFERYLAFFDQYAQSMTLWSPDSSAFAYAGTNGAGRTGIWVQQLDQAEPVRVDNGIFAAWSPR